MPQPLDTFSLHWRHGAILERAEHAKGIALVITEWAALEDLLIMLFVNSLFPRDKAGDAASNIAYIAWETLDSLTTRLSLIDALLKKRVSGELYTHFAEKIKPEIRRRSAERNRIVHGKLYLCDSYPDDIVLAYRDERPMRYTAKDLRDIADRIEETVNVVSLYCSDVEDFRNSQDQQEAP